jgi:hypothetical protein
MSRSFCQLGDVLATAGGAGRVFSRAFESRVTIFAFIALELDPFQVYVKVDAASAAH